MTAGRELGRLILEICVVLGASGAAVLLVRRFGGRAVKPGAVAAGVLALAVVVSALGNLRGAASVLNQAHRHAAGARAGLEHCFDETNGEPGPRLRLRRPFIEWVRTRLPPRAVYALAPYAGPPDSWCVALALLPALPAGPGGRSTWTIAFGTVPPVMQARIARGDPSVRVFAPGFALARDGSA